MISYHTGDHRRFRRRCDSSNLVVSEPPLFSYSTVLIHKVSMETKSQTHWIDDHTRASELTHFVSWATFTRVFRQSETQSSPPATGTS